MYICVYVLGQYVARGCFLRKGHCVPNGYSTHMCNINSRFSHSSLGMTAGSDYHLVTSGILPPCHQWLFTLPSS